MIEGQGNNSIWDDVTIINGRVEVEIDDDVAEALEGMKENDNESLNDVLKRIMKEWK